MYKEIPSDRSHSHGAMDGWCPVVVVRGLSRKLEASIRLGPRTAGAPLPAWCPGSGPLLTLSIPQDKSQVNEADDSPRWASVWSREGLRKSLGGVRTANKDELKVRFYLVNVFCAEPHVRPQPGCC